MKVGSLVYCTDQGLGILAKNLYDHGIITNPFVLLHPHRENHPEWFPGAPGTYLRRPDWQQVRRWAEAMDVLLFLETPFDWGLIPHAKDRDIRTALMVMYECTPKQLPATPDLFLCPSLLDLQYFPPEKARLVTVPTTIPWKQRTSAQLFIHNAGHGGLKGRNGTRELLEAWKFVESDARLLVRSQIPIGDYIPDSRVRVEVGTFPQRMLYKEGDVFIFPEKFNGLSLPLQEAHAAGMLIMCMNRYPMNQWLPNEPLIPVRGFETNSISHRMMEFEEAIVDPIDIAASVDHWYGQDITSFSQQGKAWSEQNSWETWKPRYLELLRGDR